MNVDTRYEKYGITPLLRAIASSGLSVGDGGAGGEVEEEEEERKSGGVYNLGVVGTVEFKLLYGFPVYPVINMAVSCEGRGNGDRRRP